MEVATTLKVIVNYPAAGEPFKADVERSETVGQLKTEVLKAFGLTEGQLPGGNTAIYTLYYRKTPLENLSQTLSEIAGDQKALELKLSQQIVQGSWDRAR